MKKSYAFLPGPDYHLEKRTDPSSQRKRKSMRRILYAVLAGLVFILAGLVGTALSAIFLSGAEL